MRTKAKRSADSTADEAERVGPRKSAKVCHEGGHGAKEDHRVSKVARFPSSMHNRTYGAGQIKQVKVRNFMCHDNMEVDFHPHVNFISGPNGSGKSAVLQALQYCLGVRANQTGRAMSNAAYVKKGKDHAVAEVTIWNTGSEGDTFMPDVFGPWITIHKTLSEKGHTSTKVLDARGHKTGLTKADDIKRLLSHLSVNAANPSIVLTQDHARGLLSSDKVESKLYDLLTESLEFDSIQDSLNHSCAEIKKQSREVKDFKDAKEEFDRKLTDLETRLEDAKHSASLQDLAGRLEDHMPWTVVKYFRGKIETLDAELVKVGPEARARIKDEIAEVDAELENFEEECKELDAVLAESTKRIEVHKVKKDELRNKRKAAAQKLRERKNALQLKQTNLKEAHESKSHADAAVARLKSAGNDTESVNLKLAQWQEQMNHATETLCAQRQTFKELRQQWTQAREDMQQATEERDSVQHDHAQRKMQIQKATADIQRLRQNHGTHARANIFHRSAADLLASVAQHRGMFKQLPIGPVGAYLSLDQEKFSATITGAIQNFLAAWIVGNREDHDTLLRLAKKHQCEPTVYIVNYNVPQYQIPPNQMPPEFVNTVYRSIKVKPNTENGHVLLNLLVDRARIESLGLVEDEESGSRLLEDADIRRNLSLVWCNHPQDGPSEIKRTEGGAKSIWPWPQHRPRPEPLLSADQSLIIQSRMQNLEHLKAAAEEVEVALTEKTQALQCAVTCVKNAEAETQNADACCSRLQSDLNRLEKSKPEIKVSADDEIGEYLLKSSDADDEIRRLMPEIQDLRDEVEKAQSDFDAIEAEKKAFDEQSDGQRKEVVGRIDYQTEVRHKKEQHAAKRAKLQNTLEQVGQKQQDLEESKAEFQKNYEVVLKDAQEVCTEEEAAEEVDELKEAMQEWACDFMKKTGTDPDTVLNDQDEISKLCQYLYKLSDRYAKSAGGAVEDLQVEVDTMRSDAEANTFRASKILELVELERKSYTGRKNRFLEIRDSTTKTISQEFQNKLKTGRNWKGRIEVDHDDCIVTLHVTPNKGTHAGQTTNASVKDMKSLSGGERSFTSVSFMLSLGSEIRTPFFAMDEFDVFMDAVNRKVSLTSILKFAWEMKEKQFILLSPLEMSAVEQSRQEVNDHLKAKAGVAKVEEMPKDFINTLAMAPPRSGARAHF